MVANHAQRWPILLVGVGLAMVVFGAQATHFANLIEFTYSVEATTQAAATEAANASDPGVDVIYHFTDFQQPHKTPSAKHSNPRTTEPRFEVWNTKSRN